MNPRDRDDERGDWDDRLDPDERREQMAWMRNRNRRWNEEAGDYED
jgi:hypothetical protein